MLERFLLTVNDWMAGGTSVAALGCFLWGMVSVVLSPCHLASIPLIVAYVGGQQESVTPRRGACFSVTFTVGLFITIALVGVVCAALGRMLGDVGSWWQILVGLVLLWVALGMMGVARCSVSGSLLYRLKLKGLPGAFVLGLGYGVLSGSCTFGFIAPILALITIQARITTGILYIVLFALGHCLPIVIAGSSTAAVQRFMDNSAWQGAGSWFRRGAGALVGFMGLYFILTPFLTA